MSGFVGLMAPILGPSHFICSDSCCPVGQSQLSSGSQPPKIVHPLAGFCLGVVGIRETLDHQYPTFKLFGSLWFSRNRKFQPFASVAFWGID